jgi:hypothetical protein
MEIERALRLWQREMGEQVEVERLVELCGWGWGYEDEGDRVGEAALVTDRVELYALLALVSAPTIVSGVGEMDTEYGEARNFFRFVNRMIMEKLCSGKVVRKAVAEVAQGSTWVWEIEDEDLLEWCPSCGGERKRGIVQTGGIEDYLEVALLDERRYLQGYWDGKKEGVREGKDMIEERNGFFRVGGSQDGGSVWDDREFAALAAEFGSSDGSEEGSSSEVYSE